MPMPRTRAYVFESPRLDRLHTGLMLAVAQASLGQPIWVYLTKRACWLWHKTGPSAWRAIDASPETETRYQDMGVATLMELLDALEPLGARVSVCPTGLHLCGLSETDLRDGAELAGMAELMQDASEMVVI